MIGNSMYKKLVALSVMFGTSICCAKDVSRMGVVNMSSEVLTNLTITGVANLDKINVSKKFVMTGPVNAQDCKFGAADITGAIHFTRITIQKELLVSGAFAGSNCQFADINITGGISMKDCTVSGNAELCGGVSCEKTTLRKDVNLTGNEFSFVNCTIMKNIKVTPLSWFGSLFKTQKIKLDQTVVHGDIIFEDDGGIVEMFDSVEFSGKVIRGTVVCKK